jgi:hypothetical protein
MFFKLVLCPAFVTCIMQVQQFIKQCVIIITYLLTYLLAHSMVQDII